MLTILRSVPSRKVDHLTKYVDLVFVDRMYEGCASFVKQLFVMNQFNDDVLFLEDDISINDQQYLYILDMIRLHPSTLINFSSRMIHDGMYKPETLLFTQCLYIPRIILKDIVSNLDVDKFLRNSHYDIALRGLLHNDYLSIYYSKAITDLRLKSVMKYF
jgi:hypothetical protein